MPTLPANDNDDNDDNDDNNNDDNEDNDDENDEDYVEDDEEDEDEEEDDEDLASQNDEEASDLSEFSRDDNDHLYTLDHYDEDALPEYACRYCGIHDPSCVAMCVESQKWFCNANSHLVHHLVRSRNNQVQLHPESPLGETILECYNCASKNAFVMGFVPASSSSVVVLLCRVCVETVPGLKDMEWELSQWHPLIQDRKFLPWLIKVPSDKLLLKARDITPMQMSKLEDLWKMDPHAKFAHLNRPEAEVKPALKSWLLLRDRAFNGLPSVKQSWLYYWLYENQNLKLEGGEIVAFQPRGISNRSSREGKPYVAVHYSVFANRKCLRAIKSAPIEKVEWLPIAPEKFRDLIRFLKA